MGFWSKTPRRTQFSEDPCEFIQLAREGVGAGLPLSQAISRAVHGDPADGRKLLEMVIAAVIEMEVTRVTKEVREQFESKFDSKPLAERETIMEKALYKAM
jgi:hypothetical protein